MRQASTRGFTLVEVALAIGVLVVGLAAVTSIYLTGLRWVGETRNQYTSLQAARVAIETPELLLDARRGEPQAADRASDSLAGWHNGYYCVRTVLERQEIAGDKDAWQRVRIEVYAGGSDEDGELIQTVDSSVVLLGRH